MYDPAFKPLEQYLKYFFCPLSANDLIFTIL